MGLCFLAFALWRGPDLRTTLRQTFALKCTGGVVLLMALQALWAVNLNRYFSYSVILAIGLAYMMLGETLARSRSRFLAVLPPLIGFWFILALFPIFDVWTGSQRFRATYILTGGPWDNINDMATVLTLVTLIFTLVKRQVSLPLLAITCFYCVALNRRADLLGLIVFVGGYLLISRDQHRLKLLLRLGSTVIVSTAFALMLHTGPFQGFSLPAISETPTQVSPPPATNPLATSSAQADSATPAPQAAPPAQPAPAVGLAAEAAPLPAPSLAPSASVRPPNESQTMPLQITLQNGDGSSATRLQLLAEMYVQARHMPWWQWIAGKGVGQLNLTWPDTGAAWASPHMFWLEMLFYFGIGWLLLLGYLFLRLDNLGRICLVSAGIAGCAPSSIIYLQPFWLFLGVLMAQLPRRQPLLT
ncbi:hypothetical protein [Bordetella avium]|uniref:hypothetical protein n=1 Tax=Bordetella avium TaxID=521 RepID=UPI0002EFC5A3|nr:hypothetical protein [Bordetella avium]